MNRAVCVATSICLLGLVCALDGCGRAEGGRSGGARSGGSRGAPPEKPQPVLFEPTVAVQLRLAPDSEGEGDIPQIRAAIEEIIKQQKRMKLVEHPADARLLIDIAFFLQKKFSGSGWYYRLQIIDVAHDVVVFEDGHFATGMLDRPQNLIEAVQQEFRETAQRLEKKLEISRQIELGQDGIAYLDTSPWRNERITFGRYDWGEQPRKIYVDYSQRALGSSLQGTALNIAVNQIYKLMQEKKVELVSSPEKADVVFRVSTESRGGRSFVRVRDGSRFHSETLSTKIEVFRKGETEPAHVLTAEGQEPEGSTGETPEMLSLKSFEAALGTKMPELRPFFQP